MKKRLFPIFILLLGVALLVIAILKLLHLDEIETAFYGMQIFNLKTTALLVRVNIFLNLLGGLSGLAWPIWHFFKSRTEKPLRVVRNLLLVLIPIIAIAVPFCCLPMDGLYNRFVPQSNNSLEMQSFAELRTDSAVVALGIDTGTCVVGILSTGCYYCRLSATKVNYLFNNCKLATDKFKMIFIGSPGGVEGFLRLTGTGSYPHVAVNKAATLNSVHGSFPTFIILKDGQVQGVYDFRGLDEKEWSARLQ